MTPLTLSSRRRWIQSAAGLVAVSIVPAGLSACASAHSQTDDPAPWESRLTGRAVVLLGEHHDNPVHHRLRLATLERVVAAGWRPAVLMEQFDTDRQPDIDRARSERPLDAQHLIEAATPARGGWNWTFYRPVVELALKAGLPLIAANLARPSAQQLVRRSFDEVFGAEHVRALGLDAPIAADWHAVQQEIIEASHCGALPASVVPGMVRAQFARDAVMAELMTRHADRGVVLLAGNGHVRRDLGVPRWLRGEVAARAWVVGYVEPGDEDSASDAFDAIVVAPAPPRDDPCKDFKPPKAS
jgi:uncharacterized iron-regulated protein